MKIIMEGQPDITFTFIPSEFLFITLKSDFSGNISLFQAFVKRILQICSFQQPAFTCGTLFMISEVRAELNDMMMF